MHFLDSFETNPSPCLLTEQEISVEFGRNWWNAEIRNELKHLSEKCQLKQKIQCLYQDNKINLTENRAVTHVAWRDKKQQFAFSHYQAIHQAHQKALDFYEKIMGSGEYTDIVNVGIGGSHLGNLLVCEALRDYDQKRIRTHFLSSPDPDVVEDLLSQLNPKKTLWLFTSKSFKTMEVIALLKVIKRWFIKKVSEKNWVMHAFAITNNLVQAQKEGFSQEQCFWFDEGVGGRFSLWSTVGLIILFALGKKNYEDLLAGAHTMDLHFLHQPLDHNIPVWLAWLDYFYSHFFHSTSRVVIPYTARLKNLPQFLQQLEMESLGKSTQRNGDEVKDNGLVIWGDVGPNGQHAFHQFLYQTNQLIPVEFITFKSASHFQELQNMQMAQCLAQSKALWEGLADEKNPHKKVNPYKPSTLIILEKLNPYNLGLLLAMYEHKVFVLGEMYNLNAFDQFGVEFGKDYANLLLKYFTDQLTDGSVDSISQSLIELLRCR